MKALAAGVPLVVLPHGRDQLDNAVRVTTRGAGVKLKRTATADEIAQSVRAVLENPSYRAAAVELGACIRRDSERSTLIDELEDLRNGDLARLPRG